MKKKPRAKQIKEISLTRKVAHSLAVNPNMYIFHQIDSAQLYKYSCTTTVIDTKI